MGDSFLVQYEKLCIAFLDETAKYHGKPTAASAARLRKISNEMTKVGKSFRKESNEAHRK